MERQIYENNYLLAWKEGKIACAKYKENVIIGLDAAREIVAFRKKIFPEDGLHLIYIYNIHCLSNEARNYFASREAVEGIVKGAFVIKSEFQKIMGNIFIKVNKPLVPAKLFTDDKEAIKWLLSS